MLATQLLASLQKIMLFILTKTMFSTKPMLELDTKEWFPFCHINIHETKGNHSFVFGVVVSEDGDQSFFGGYVVSEKGKNKALSEDAVYFKALKLYTNVSSNC